MWRRKINWSDVSLVSLLLLMVALGLKASDDPIPSALRRSRWEPLLAQFATGNQIIFDLTVGFFSAIATYFLFVRLPEHQKRTRIIRQLSETLREVKLNCIRTFLSMLGGGGYPSGLPEELLDQARFRTFFHAEHAPGQSRWGQLANEINDYWLAQLRVELCVLREEIQFALAALEPRSDVAFERMKSLYGWAVRTEAVDLDSDDLKSLFRTLWGIHTGYSFVDRYTGKDHVADQIASL